MTSNATRNQLAEAYQLAFKASEAIRQARTADDLDDASAIMLEATEDALHAALDYLSQVQPTA